VPKCLTDKLQRVLNAAARVVSGTKKFDFDSGLTHLRHAQLHWLDSPDRVSYKITTMVYRCIHGQTPQYLVDCCTPITDLRPRHSTSSPLCQAPSARRSTLSALHLRPSGVLGCCTSDLGFTAGRSAGSGTEFRRRQFFLIISAFSALGVFYCRCTLQI